MSAANTPHKSDSGYLSMNSGSFPENFSSPKRKRESPPSVRHETSLYTPEKSACTSRMPLQPLSKRFAEDELSKAKDKYVQENVDCETNAMIVYHKQRSMSIPSNFFAKYALSNDRIRKGSFDGVLENSKQFPVEKQGIYSGWLDPTVSENDVIRSYYSIDFLKDLSQRNMHSVVSHILSFLPPNSLLSVMFVSRTWYELVITDWHANNRRILCLKESKSNRLVGIENRSKGKCIEPVLLEHSVNITLLPQVGSLLYSPYDDGLGLLMKCPKCTQAAQILTSSNTAICMNFACGYCFCRLCFYEGHGTTGCPSADDDYLASIISNKMSRKNLRRL